MTKLRVLDLFSGIGGFSLGLERTGGFETVAFCEIEEYPRRVLAKHWPGVPIYHDVRELTADALRRDRIAVDVICGGFPCQDLSFAGKRAGLEGARSGLWGEYGRIIGEVRPRFVIVENVPGLLSLGMGTVLGDLSALGYDAVWDCVPASAVSAPHRRDRVWLVAYTDSPAIRQQSIGKPRRSRKAVASANCSTTNANGEGEHAGAIDAEMGGASQSDPDASPMLRPQIERGKPDRDCQLAQDVADADSCDGEHSSRMHSGIHRQAQGPWAGRRLGGCDPRRQHGQWLTEPDVGRVAHGVPSRVDRLRGLGNAVVPQIPELIGRAILQAEGLT